MHEVRLPLGWLMSLLTICFCFSCQMEEMIPDLQAKSDEVAENEHEFDATEIPDFGMNLRLGPWNMIFEETFEGEEPFYAYVHKQFAAAHSFSVASSPALRGIKSGRFELRRDDPQATENGKRSEVLFPVLDHKNRWFSFGLYLPSDGFAKDRDNDVLSQWSQAKMGSPPISFRVQNDRFLLRLKDKTDDTENIDLGLATKNAWHEFTFHIVHSDGTDGLIEIWHNGKKIVTRNGGNIYTGPLPSWKVGIYKPAWENSNTDTKVRVAYFDNVRIGNENATYEEMAPSQDNNNGWGPVVPEIKNIILINAFTNQVANEIADGGIINRSLLNTERVSIRTDMSQTFGGSVQFDLKGPRNNVYVDNDVPYALFGDDGSGKYYHSGGLPLGNYTLTVTPFAEQKGKGKAGNAKTIKFKVIDEEVTDGSIPTVEGFTDGSIPTVEGFTDGSIPAVEGFILIQANIDKKLGPLVDGEVISLTRIGTHKLTIEALLPSTFIGEMEFKLSGTRNRVSSAGSAPYTLYNYKNGDYTFGDTGLPAGTYKLDATPVVKEGGNITYGTTKTIQFTVVE